MLTKELNKAAASIKMNRWILSQRIALLGHLLGSRRATLMPGSKLLKSREFFRILRQRLEYLLEDGARRHAHFLEGLPPVVLEILLAIPPLRLGDVLRDRRSVWERIRENHFESHKYNISRIEAAKIAATHLLHPLTPGDKFSAMVARTFRDLRMPAPFEQEIQTLKSPCANTLDKLDAITEMGKHMQDRPEWTQLENALLHMLFTWPVLVLGRSAVSLPTCLDVFFDGQGQSASVAVLGGEVVKPHGWGRSLERVARAAKDLWRSKHGNFGRFRDTVETASILLDLSMADEIVRHLVPRRYQKDYVIGVALEGSSMEAYFCQAVLSRFVGATCFAAAVTGSIGRRITRESEEGIDFEFRWPAKAAEKLRFIFQTKYFERVIVPNFKNLPARKLERQEHTFITKALKREQNTEVNQAANLQTVANCVFGHGWRANRYVRCPDIAWALHPTGRRLLPNHESLVEKCLAELRDSKSSVCWLSEELNLIHLASALYHLNRKSTREANFNYSLPPKVNWSFVRTTPDETGLRFWWTVWGAISGSRKLFEEFCRSENATAAARVLAKALNFLSPSEFDPARRAPDLLILVGTKRQLGFIDPCMAFETITQQLDSRSLLASTHFNSIIGGTRLILLQEDQKQCAVNSESFQEVNDDEYHILDALSTFRFGFTQNMAQLLLNEMRIELPEIRMTLKRFVRKGFLRYRLGTYHLTNWEPSRLDDQFLAVGGRNRLYEAYYCEIAAGKAYAPYLFSTRMPRVSLDRSFRPENIHEAKYHLLRAKHYAKSLNLPTARALLKKLTIIDEIIDCSGWHTVIYLMKGRANAKANKLSQYLLSVSRNQGRERLHPRHLLTAAMAAEAHLVTLLRHADVNPEKIRKKILHIGALYKEAAFSAEKGHRLDRGNCNLLLVLTRWAFFLAKFGRTPDDVKTEQYLTRRALALLDKGTPGTYALGEWFELVGDRLKDHVRALRLYHMGVVWTPAWRPLWIKYIGAKELAAHDPRLEFGEDELRYYRKPPTKRHGIRRRYVHINHKITKEHPLSILRYPPDILRMQQVEVVNLLKLCSAAPRRWKQKDDTWVTERWKSALAGIMKQFASDSLVVDAATEVCSRAQVNWGHFRSNK